MSVEKIAADLNTGADMFERIGRLTKEMRRLHTDDVLSKAAGAMLMADFVREGIRDIAPMAAEISKATIDVHTLWDGTLEGTDSETAVQLRASAAELAHGDFSAETLVHGGLRMEEKLTEVEDHLAALLRSAGELDDIYDAWRFAAQTFVNNAHVAAHDARNLAASMGGDA